MGLGSPSSGVGGRRWTQRVIPESVVHGLESTKAQQQMLEAKAMTRYTEAMVQSVTATQELLNGQDRRVRLYLPAKQAFAYQSKETLGRATMPKVVQFLFMSRRTLMARVIGFDAMLVAGVIIYCYALTVPAGAAGFGGLLLIPAAFSGLMFLHGTLLKLCMRQFTCNFMFLNLVGLGVCIWYLYIDSLAVRVGFLGILLSGTMYCYQDATPPVFRGRWTAVASAIAVMQLVVIAIMLLLDVARPSHTKIYIRGLEHDVTLRAVSFIINLVIYQSRVVLQHWTNASHRLISVQSATRPVLVSQSDMVDLQRIVTGLQEMEHKKESATEGKGQANATVRVLYPLIRPRLSLHADCILARYVSPTAFRVAYMWVSLGAVRLLYTLGFGAGMGLSVLAATQHTHARLAPPGCILVGLVSLGHFVLLNWRLLRSLLRRFEIVFLLGNTFCLLVWGALALESKGAFAGWCSVLVGVQVSFLSDALPAKMALSRGRTAIAWLCLGSLCLLLPFLFTSVNTIDDVPWTVMGRVLSPLEMSLGGLLNVTVFTFKAALFGLRHPKSLWSLRPQMVTSRMPQEFFELYRSLVEFEPDRKEGSNRSMSSFSFRLKRGASKAHVKVDGIGRIVNEVITEGEE